MRTSTLMFGTAGLCLAAVPVFAIMGGPWLEWPIAGCIVYGPIAAIMGYMMRITGD